MVKEIEFNEEQTRSLADKIEELYLMDQIVATGLEVLNIVLLSGINQYKVDYTFERENNSLAFGTVYCKFGFDGSSNRVVDFREC